MQKRLMLFVLYGFLIALAGLFAACGSTTLPAASTTRLTSTASTASDTITLTPTGTAAQQTNTNAASATLPQVHMKDMDFLQNALTIKKGESITLVSDTPTPHQITNGSWSSGGIAQPATEKGAPHVNVTVPGESQRTIGPFMTVGTFHYYCTIHQGMNLTVIVQP
jgi:plastocyanin